MKVASYEIDGNALTLSGPSGSELLVFQVSAGADLLLGGWNATSLYTGDAIQSPVPGSAPTLAFADGRVSGNSGCNTFGGAYKISAHDGIEIGPLQSTLASCADPAISTQERQYTAALQLAQTYRVTGGELTLFRPGGTIAATFERATGPTSGS